MIIIRIYLFICAACFLAVIFGAIHRLNATKNSPRHEELYERAEKSHSLVGHWMLIKSIVKLAFISMIPILHLVIAFSSIWLMLISDKHLQEITGESLDKYEKMLNNRENMRYT